MRSWTYFGVDSGVFLDDGSVYYHFIYPDPRLVRMTGTREQIKEFCLFEDETGEYWGWISEGRDYPTLIQLQHAFKVQFPGGYQESVDRGQGKVIRLNIKNVKDYETTAQGER